MRGSDPGRADDSRVSITGGESALGTSAAPASSGLGQPRSSRISHRGAHESKWRQAPLRRASATQQRCDVM